MGRGTRTELRPRAGPVSPGVWRTLRRDRKIEAREKAAWPGSCRLRPDQCRIASCVAVPVIVTRFAI